MNFSAKILSARTYETPYLSFC